MKAQQRVALCFVSLMTLFSLATATLASCPRRQIGPPCEEYWQADAVFIAVAHRVVNVRDESLSGFGPYARTAAYFTIEESFKGVAGTEIVFDSTSCGYIFEEGTRYLVYAYRNGNELQVRVAHTRTRPIAEATEDLQYIRGLASTARGSRVFGKVTQSSFDIRKNESHTKSLQGIKVIVEGNQYRNEVVTDSEGRYELKTLPAGTYRIQPELPAHLTSETQTIKLTGHDCLPLDLFAEPAGQIAGRVVDKNGLKVIGVPVSVVPADASYEEIFAYDKNRSVWPFTLTSRDGGFRFSGLAPGRYLLIINRTERERLQGRPGIPASPPLFYPGVLDAASATVIVVGKDDKRREYDFQLPLP